MNTMHTLHERRSRRGAAALLSVLFLSMLLASFTLAGLSVTGRALAGESSHREHLASRYAAEAGLGQAIFSLRNGGEGNHGSADAPVPFGGGSYWVEITPLEDDVHTLVAAGRQNHHELRIEAMVRVGAATMPRPAIFALEGIRMDSNARVDSYDAAEGSYESQATNHQGNLYANTSGTVASNGSIVLASNAAVYGNATPGPAGSVTLMGNSTVSGVTLPAETQVEVPVIDVPEAESAGDYLVIRGLVRTLDTGLHAFDRMRLGSNSTLLVRGPATIVVEDFRIDSNARLLADTSDGPVELYVASDFLLGSNTLLSPLNFQPTELAVYLSADNMTDPEALIDLDETSFESNARLYGTLIAPNALIAINSNFQLFGSLVARRVHLDSNSRVHFDEQLSSGESGERAVEVLSWRIASRSVDMHHAQ